MAQAGQIPTSPSDGENYLTFLLTVSNTGGQVLVQPPGFALLAPGLAHVHLALERFPVVAPSLACSLGRSTQNGCPLITGASCA